ncbi:MAG: PD40 domain-containing protein [Chitinispirillaceae bacterium]|nr:PD40 domain-containing protein [Chitinispirillaceae bacterium]
MRNGKIHTVSSRLGYTAWHPSGRLIAFSVYNVEQFFHAVGRNILDQYDKNASIVMYNTAQNALDPVPALVDQRFLQTWPEWSPDGRWLYFCRAPVLWTDFTKSPPDNYDKVKYSLCRIFYNEADNSWGAVDTILSPGETGLSISQPRISPDGRFLLFCMHDRGIYPHTQKSSDLYMMDLGSRRTRRLDINSEYNESWHGWSSNGRWMLFSSKRGGGIFTRLYFSYVDSSGCAHKPFILPQEDPSFYESFIKCCNVPEFAVASVTFDQRDLLRAIRSRAKIQVPVSATGAVEPAWRNMHIR